MTLGFVQLLGSIAGQSGIFVPKADRFISLARNGFHLPLQIEVLPLSCVGTLNRFVSLAQDSGDFDKLLTNLTELRLGFRQARSEVITLLLNRRRPGSCLTRCDLQVINEGSDLLGGIYIVHRRIRTVCRPAGVSLWSEVGIIRIRLRHNAGFASNEDKAPRTAVNP